MKRIGVKLAKTNKFQFIPLLKDVGFLEAKGCKDVTDVFERTPPCEVGSVTSEKKE